jgi:hypothetical protein
MSLANIPHKIQVKIFPILCGIIYYFNRAIKQKISSHMSESPKEPLDRCKNNMLKSLQDLGDGAYESLLQNDHQRLIAQYYFGKFNTHAKRLYYQVMGKPRNYG